MSPLCCPRSGECFDSVGSLCRLVTDFFVVLQPPLFRLRDEFDVIVGGFLCDEDLACHEDGDACLALTHIHSPHL